MSEPEISADLLVPAGEAIEILAREHDRRGTYADWQVCLTTAHDTLLARTLAGHLNTYAETCNIDTDEREPTFELPSQFDYYRSTTHTKIPSAFWIHYNNSTRNWRSYDLVTCDFIFRCPGDEWEAFHWRSGGAYSVCFDRRGLPLAAFPMPSAPTIGPMAATSNAGRKPGKWWPTFAEELAIWCLRNDPPDGEGTEGQSEMIDAIFKGLQERGIDEPGRETIRPVINAVLTRYRTSRN